LIGHKDHQEIVAPRAKLLIARLSLTRSTPSMRSKSKIPRSFRSWTQTTLSLYDTQEIVARLRQKFPAIKGPASDDICYATQNRQEAVEQVAKDVDFILVVGSPNSSNSNRLVEVAKRSGVKAQLIDSAKTSIPRGSWECSALVLQLALPLRKFWSSKSAIAWRKLVSTDQRDLDLIREDVRFTLPPELATIAAAPRR